MVLVKLVGAALIVLASSRFGGMYAAKFDRRRKELKAFSDALELLETEVVYGTTPLPRALGRLAERTPPPVGRFFGEVIRGLEVSEDLTGSWREALRAYYGGSCLLPTDRDSLLPLGDVLGTSDRADQARHLRSVGQRLRHNEADAQRDEEKNAKLWRSVGILGGLALAILFL